MEDKDNQWPAWRYGPGGRSQIFQREADVPSGWKDHPSKVGHAESPKQSRQPEQPKQPASGGAEGEELDAHGHPWSADLHASTKAKTKAGLWRMKVGASRPAPMPGYPLDL